MKPQPTKKLLRCAIYTRKSTEHNLDLEFNSLDAQREACEAYIKSPGGWSGHGTMMADCPGPLWTALPCRSYWATSVAGRSMSSSSTRWTG
jgi:hypothetical protein